ncbi:MAG: rod shape-determining protein MreD [Pseudomonadota bacterium]
MADSELSKMWFMRLLYVCLALLVLFFQLMPLDTVPRIWAGPDITLALTFAWVLRRPEYVPPLLVACVLLLGDLLLHRPPGLWAVLVVLGAETLRARYTGLRDMTFVAEWVAVASTLAVVTLAYRLVLGLALVDQAPLGLNLIQVLMTLIAYPVVVGVSQVLFGVRKRAPGDLDPLGGRI